MRIVRGAFHPAFEMEALLLTWIETFETSLNPFEVSDLKLLGTLETK